MPLQDFRELVKDKPELLKEVEQVFGKAEAAEKIQSANTDISRERDDLKAKVGTLTTEKASLEGVKKDLELKLAEAGKGAKPDEAVLNGLKEQIANLQKTQTEAAEREAKAIQDKRAMELKSSIISAAGKAVNPNQVFALMQAEGLVGITDKGESFFHKRNEKGEPIALKAEEAVEAYLSSNAHLVKSSGNGGSGGNTNPATANPKSGLLEKPEAAL